MANTIEVIIKATDKASAAIENVGETTKQTGKQISSLGDTLKMLGPAFTAVGIVAAGKAAFELGKLGAQSLRTTRAFENISGGATEAGERLDAMRIATRGAMTEQEMMGHANLLMQMGLANTADELGSVTEMAVKLGTAMGHGAGEAISSFSAMLANQSIPRLDTFGISSGKVRERIAELQKQFVGMSREEAFMRATMEQGRIAMVRLGASTEDEMLASEQLTAAMSDLKTMAGEMLAPAMATVARSVADGTRAIIDAQKETNRLTELFGEDAQMIRQWSQAGPGGAKRAAEALENLRQIEESLVVGPSKDLMRAQMEAAGAMDTMAIASDTAALAQDGLATASSKVAGAFGEMEFDNESLWNLALASGASVESLSLLAQQLGIASSAEITATIKAYEAVEAFGAGTISADEYAAAMTRIGDAASEAAAKADRLAQLAATGFGAGGAPKGYQHGTSFYPGGVGLVGERGPEMVALPRGSQVYPSTSYSNARTLNDQRSWNVTVSNQAMAGLVMNTMRQQRLDRLNQMM